MDRFGTRIRDARMARGMTIATLASGIMDSEALVAIESCASAPDVSLVARLAGRLGIQHGNDMPTDDQRLDAAIAIERAMREGNHVEVANLIPELGSLATDRPVYRAFPLERSGDLGAAIATLNATPGDESPTWAFRRLLALCRCQRDAGNLDASATAGESALVLAQETRCADAALLTELRATLAGTYCETGALARALDLTEPAAKFSEAEPWADVTRLWARAMVLQTMQRFPEALDSSTEALFIMRPLNRPGAYARLQNVTAWIALQCETCDEHFVGQLLQESEATFRALQAPSELALVLTTKAELALRDNDAPTTRAALGEAALLVASQESGDRARITAAAAQMYAALGDTESATQQLLVARQLLEDSGAKRSAAAIWKQMAETHASLGQQDLQIACLRAAMDLLEL